MQAGESEQKARVSQANISTFSVDSETDYIVEWRVNEYLVNILIDTSAAATIVSNNVWEKMSRTDKCHWKEVSGSTRDPTSTEFYHTY